MNEIVELALYILNQFEQSYRREILFEQFAIGMT